MSIHHRHWWWKPYKWSRSCKQLTYVSSPHPLPPLSLHYLSSVYDGGSSTSGRGPVNTSHMLVPPPLPSLSLICVWRWKIYKWSRSCKQLTYVSRSHPLPPLSLHYLLSLYDGGSSTSGRGPVNTSHKLVSPPALYYLLSVYDGGSSTSGRGPVNSSRMFDSTVWSTNTLK